MRTIYQPTILLILMTVGSCFATKKAEVQSANPPPNIIFIICDDLNDIAVSGAGHPQASMPHLAQLAAQGINFTNAFTNAPICAPSRGSFLTGIAPEHSRYFGFRHEKRYYRASPVLKDAKTFVHHFYDNGYKVYGTGKVFHNGSKEWPHDDYGITQSFSPFPWDGSYVAWGVDSLGFKPHPNQPEVLQTSWESTFGSLAQIPVYRPNPEKGINGHRGWMSYSEPFRYESSEDRDLMPDEKSANYAIDVLNQTHDQPFLLAIGFTTTHTPYYAPQNYLDRFPLDQLTSAKIKDNDLADCADILAEEEGTSNTDYGFRRYNEIMEAGGEAMLKQWTQAYLACAALVDDQLGKIIKALESSPYKDNTVIVFTSDHGFHMGEKEFLFKNSVWHESLHVPLVLAGAGVSQGKVKHPVSLLDLYPTFNELAGLSNNPNENTNQVPLDGFSLVPFFQKLDSAAWEGPDFVTSVVQGTEITDMDDPTSVHQQHYIATTEQYSYVLCNDGKEELYDKLADPYEWNNLADQPQYQSVKATLKAKLQQRIAYFNQNNPSKF